MRKPPVIDPPEEKPAAKKRSEDEWSRLAAWLRKARAGEARDLDKVIRDAGYGDPPGDQVIITSRQLEKGLGLSRRQIQEYITAGMPKLTSAYGNRPATFDLWSAMRWLRELWRKAGGLDPDEAAKYERQKREMELRRQRAETELKERQAALEGGRLVDRNRVESEFNLVLQRIQLHLQGLPAEMASVVPPAVADQVARDGMLKVRSVWTSALDEIRRILPPPKTDPIPEPTASESALGQPRKEP